MASVASADLWQEALASRTCRHFRRAVVLALGVLALGSLLYTIETLLLGLEQRFIENPGSTMMRAGGIAHFCMGWLFLFTSRQLRHPQALLRLAFWTLLGGVLCVLASTIGTLSHPFLFSAFYGFFLFHEVRDQAALFAISPAAPLPAPQSRVFLSVLVPAVAVSLWSVATLGVVIHGLFLRPHPALTTAAPFSVLALAVLTLLANGWLWWRVWQVSLHSWGNLRSALGAHAPLLLVYLGILGVLVLGVLLGGIALNLIILIHGGTWFFFVWDRLRESPPRKVGNLWVWLRSTPNGFLTLHLLLFVVVVTLFALRVHLWNRCGLVSAALAANSFMYWSMMHIAMSLWRKD